MSKERKNNHTIKIFSLVIAIILWSYVMSEVNPKITKEFRNVDVKFSKMEDLESSGLELISPKEVKINVKLSGRRSEILKLRDTDIIAEVDLSGYSEGTKKVPIYVKVPSQVDIVDYSPREVAFRFEKVISKEKQVELKTIGKLEPGYSLGEGEVKPQSIILKGPKSWVNSVSDVVAVVDITGKTEDINATVPIKLLDDDGNTVGMVEKDPNVVDVFIPMSKSKKVPIDAQISGEIPIEYRNSKLVVTPKSVDVKGNDNILNSLSSIKTEPIDAYSLVERGSIEAKLIVPEGIDLVNPKQKIIVTLKLNDTDTETDNDINTDSNTSDNADDRENSDIDNNTNRRFEYNFSEIQIRNLGNGLIVDQGESTNNISILLSGPDNVLNSVRKDSLSPEIDLGGLDEGTHEVKLIVKDINKVKVLDIIPNRIKISLKKEERE